MEIEIQVLFAAFAGGAIVAIVCEIADRRFHNRLIARIEEGNREACNWLRESRQPTQADIDAAGKVHADDGGGIRSI